MANLANTPKSITAHSPSIRPHGMGLQEIILASPELYIRQKVRWLEILTNWDTANRYDLSGSQGQVVGQIIERGGGLLTILARLFLRSHRGFSLDVVDLAGVALLNFSRKFFWFFSDIAVSTPQGMKIGSAHRRFSIFWKKYDLQDPSGRTFARIKSGFWRLWTFQVVDERGATLATISKKWGGAMKEIFTNSDTFQVQFGPQHWKAHERAVLIAVAMTIEFDHFEGKGNSSGLMSLLGN
jgi:uncharacterized protein YxjI